MPLNGTYIAIWQQLLAVKHNLDPICMCDRLGLVCVHTWGSEEVRVGEGKPPILQRDNLVVWELAQGAGGPGSKYPPPSRGFNLLPSKGSGHRLYIAPSALPPSPEACPLHLALHIQWIKWIKSSRIAPVLVGPGLKLKPKAPSFLWWTTLFSLNHPFSGLFSSSWSLIFSSWLWASFKRRARESSINTE